MKYYRAPRYRVMLWNVEERCTDCTNKRSSLFETTYICKDFNWGYICASIVRVHNCECWYKMWTLKHPNVYLRKKFQSRISNWNFHPLPVHRFPEILITTVFLNDVKIRRHYPKPKYLYKQETTNKRTKNVLNNNLVPKRDVPDCRINFIVHLFLFYCRWHDEFKRTAEGSRNCWVDNLQIASPLFPLGNCVGP